MGKLTGVVIASVVSDQLRELIGDFTTESVAPFPVDIVQAETPAPPMSLCVQSDDLEADLARCKAAGYPEAWRSEGQDGQLFVMTSESGGAAILLVSRASATPSS